MRPRWRPRPEAMERAIAKARCRRAVLRRILPPEALVATLARVARVGTASGAAAEATGAGLEAARAGAESTAALGAVEVARAVATPVAVVRVVAARMRTRPLRRYTS